MDRVDAAAARPSAVSRVATKIEDEGKGHGIWWAERNPRPKTVPDVNRSGRAVS